MTEQMIDCSTRVMNHEYDHKFWNYSVEFDMFIHPEKNLSVPLKDQIFDRLTHCCVTLLHHLEKFKEFLTQMTHVTNQLTSICRSFHELDFMPILLTLGALVGLHLVNPFIYLTMSSKTTYKELIPSFKQLYMDLTETDAEKLIQTSTPAFKFISEDVFHAAKYRPELIASLDIYATEFKEPLIMLFNKFLPRLAEGFRTQKGHIFGFGGEEEPEGSYRVDLLPEESLEGVPVNTLMEETSVGYVNQELKVRGPAGFDAASASLVKNKNLDLIERLPTGTFNQYRKKQRK